MPKKQRCLTSIIFLCLILSVPAQGFASLDLENTYYSVESIEDTDPSGIAVSPDGNNLYLSFAGMDALRVMCRNPSTGGFSMMQAFQDGEDGVGGLNGASNPTVSPDGAYVFVLGKAGKALSVFARDKDTGFLTYLEHFFDGQIVRLYKGDFGILGGLDSPSALTVSPDSRHLYVTSRGDGSAIAIFLITSSGLKYVGDQSDEDFEPFLLNMTRPTDITVHPSGDYVLVASEHGSNLMVFSRNLISGVLTPVFVDRITPPFSSVRNLACSPDGKSVYLGEESRYGVSEPALHVFSIDASGELSPVETLDTLAPTQIVVSPAGDHVYVLDTTGGSSHIAALSRDSTTGELAPIASYPHYITIGTRSRAVITADGSELFLATQSDDLARVPVLHLYQTNASNGTLVFNDTYQLGNFGLTLVGASSVSVSPDGKNVYVGSSIDNALNIFSRNPIDGRLFHVSDILMSELTEPHWINDVVISPDGGLACATYSTNPTVLSFVREPETGMLEQADSHALPSPSAPLFSPDGSNLYVVSNDSVVVFSVAANGTLTQEQVLDNTPPVYDMRSPVDIAISPDGRFLYVTSRDDNAVTYFFRNTSTGRLLFIGSYKDGVVGVDGLGGAFDMAISPDGAHLYVYSYTDDCIAIFSRDTELGGLSQIDVLNESGPGFNILEYVLNIRFSHDGSSLYLVGADPFTIFPRGFLARFSRDPETGILDPKELIRDVDEGISGLHGSRGLGLSPDGKSIYVAAEYDHALTHFRDTTPSLSLYFPYVSCNSGWDTELCMINTGLTAAHGVLKGYDENGTLIVNEPMTLPTRGRQALDASHDLAESEDLRYCVLESDSAHLVGYTLFSYGGVMRGAVPAVKNPPSGDILVPHVGYSAQWWTGLGLVNIFSVQRNPMLHFNNGSSATLDMDPTSQLSFPVQSLFASPPSGIESAKLEDAPGLLAMELFGSGSMLAGVGLSDETATTLYFPHVAPGGGMWWTGLAVYNPGIFSNTLTITAYSETGSVLATQSRTLAPEEKLLGSVQGLGLPAATAWVRVEGTRPMSGLELFGTADGNQLAGYSVVNFSTSSGVLPKIDTLGWTGIALVNIQSSTVNVTLTAYDDSGSVVGTTSVLLNGYAKTLGTQSMLFTGQDVSQASYVAFSATAPVAAFQLNGSTDAMMLDALPALR